MQPRNPSYHKQTNSNSLQRVRWWYALLLVACGVFVVRAFYLQVIRHDHYEKAALFSQLKQYEIPASRGVISAHSGDKIVPIVLNETVYTLFADPKYIKDPHAVATAIQGVIGGDTGSYEQHLKNPDSPRYTILAKKITSDQATKIKELDLKGVGTRDSQQRTYPNGQLASQLLGFVNNDGDGTYGLEQALDAELKGIPGRLKAITDAQGVPLPANHDNLVQDPVSGKNVALTVDIAMQQQLEDLLAEGVKKANSKSGGAMIMDIKTGAIKALANYPTYDPSKFSEQKDVDVFNNMMVGAPLEPGSITKLLTTAAAIDSGAISQSSSYNNPGSFTVDGKRIADVEGFGAIGNHSVQDILTMSLNTGATWMLMQMGGGEINKQGRGVLHTYLVDHFHMGSQLGIEQSYEGDGDVQDPDTGYGLNIRYANMSFGQGYTATMLQMGAAVAAILNGGTYNVPHLVDGYIDPTTHKLTPKAPTVWKKGVVKQSTSNSISELMKGVYSRNWRIYAGPQPTDTYSIGGKTGTAEIANPSGGYYTDKSNGTFIGYVGGDTPQYLVVIRVNEPNLPHGYAGSGAAAPIFGNAVQMLINSGSVTPKT